MLPWRRKRGRTPPKDPPVPQPASDHRIYAIGDVHGRHDLLDEMLVRLRADADAQTDDRQTILVFLGDLIDRGDHTREVLDLAIGALLTWPQTICLRGNHEAALLSFLANPERGAPWLGFGGRQTLASYGISAPSAHADPAALQEAAQALAETMGSHRNFLEETQRLFRSGDVVLSHAGFDPAQPLEAQSDSALLWGQSPFLESGPPQGLRAVHGHWATPEPAVTPSRISVDTGAYYTGRLTAVRLDRETKLFTVDVFDL